MPQEQIVLSASSSQILNFWTFMLLGACMLAGAYSLYLFVAWEAALAWMVALALAMLWKYLDVRCQRYALSTERLKTQKGVFSKVTHELELYRVKDIMLEQPFFLRLFGLGNVVLMTTDASTPSLTLRAIPDAENWREKLRRCAEDRRDQKRTRVTEMD
ncbi:MAG: PH domain-containing protein [Pseudomonadota bacterium]|nr:PH domain-containing protein [Pseudomonadota bacterium]